VNQPSPGKPFLAQRLKATVATVGLTVAGGALTAAGVAAVLTAGSALLVGAVLAVLLGAVVSVVSLLPTFAHEDAGRHRVVGFATGALVGLVALMIAWG
jgi:hypothetical protein